MSDGAAESAQPVRVRLSRTKGWRMPPNTVKVDRTTKWGNPHLASVHGNAVAVALLEADLRDRGGFISARTGEKITQEHIVTELVGKNLACWCAEGEPCHVDLYLRIANPSGGEKND